MGISSILWATKSVFIQFECSLWKLYFVNETLPLFACLMFVQTVTSVLLQRYKFFLQIIFNPVYPEGDLPKETGLRFSPKILGSAVRYVCFSEAVKLPRAF